MTEPTVTSRGSRYGTNRPASAQRGSGGKAGTPSNLSSSGWSG
jgi:hypothetical protein